MKDELPINDIDRQKPATTATDPHLLQLLVCPRTKGSLIWDKSASELISTQAGLAFQVRQGVPMLGLEQTRKLSEDEMKKWRHPQL